MINLFLFEFELSLSHHILISYFVSLLFLATNFFQARTKIITISPLLMMIHHIIIVAHHYTLNTHDNLTYVHTFVYILYTYFIIMLMNIQSLFFCNILLSFVNDFHNTCSAHSSHTHVAYFFK